ncbi:FAD-dependent oxidoreductase [Collinsella sp. zg1085]|uniref:FAD-dependent oxidoreductase n=1 Tax=Collinsella sp. zg1085 TaxID=2844380 RepID=UPI00209B74D9|nr:FAD-dependent oxidoreductase [Collinsella sp. zg1085]
MEEMQADVVVVAAGLSGLAAAVAAAEGGAQVICLEKSSNTGGAANMGMGPAAAGSPVQKAAMIEVTPGELFRRHMFYTHYQVDPRLVRAYYFKSGDTIAWLQDMGVEFHSVRPAFRARERTRAYADGEYTWHVVQPEDGSEPGPRAATTMTKRLTERAQELGVEFIFECPATGLETDDNGAVVGVFAQRTSGEEVHIAAGSVIVATGGFGNNAKMIKERIGFEWGKDLFSFAIPGMDGDGINMCHKVGAGHTPVTMEAMYQLPDNMNHFYIEGAFRQPCYWCDQTGERFMPEDEIYNTTFVGNAINNLPGKVAYAIFDAKMLKRWKKYGPDIVSHIHPHDLYEGFEDQWNQDLADGYEPIAQADTLEELAEKIGIDPEGLVANVAEYNDMCAAGHDELFEKEREFMMPLEKGPFYVCKQYIGAYGTLGGVLINHKMEVLTDDHKKIDNLYCVGTDACTIYGDSYNYCIPGNTMGFCLNSGRIAGENAAAQLFDY